MILRCFISKRILYGVRWETVEFTRSIVYSNDYTHGGDMASTWVAKPRVHAEDSTPRKIYWNLSIRKWRKLLNGSSCLITAPFLWPSVLMRVEFKCFGKRTFRGHSHKIALKSVRNGCAKTLRNRWWPFWLVGMSLTKSKNEISM